MSESKNFGAFVMGFIVGSLSGAIGIAVTRPPDRRRNPPNHKGSSDRAQGQRPEYF